jgi:hypothetical protein
MVVVFIGFPLLLFQSPRASGAEPNCNTLNRCFLFRRFNDLSHQQLGASPVLDVRGGSPYDPAAGPAGNK